jgi:hypothetical protein
MGFDDRHPILHTLSEVGSIAAGLGALSSAASLAQMNRQLQEMADEQRRQRLCLTIDAQAVPAALPPPENKPASLLAFERSINDRGQEAQRLACDGNWYAPPAVEVLPAQAIDEPTPPPVICAPPRRGR